MQSLLTPSSIIFLGAAVAYLVAGYLRQKLVRTLREQNRLLAEKLAEDVVAMAKCNEMLQTLTREHGQWRERAMIAEAGLEYARETLKKFGVTMVLSPGSDFTDPAKRKGMS
jgi:hypothetical protein